ncbi:MAG: AMP-binding protein [Streptosporangiales bacterium]|nr:AMP-binding protein [Streptosporangiales bacterium]
MSAEEYFRRPWLDFYQRGVPADVEIPSIPLTRLLDDAAKRYGRKDALIFLGRKMTYNQVRAAADRMAVALAGFGVRKGDRVALILPNCPQQVIAFYGVLRLGAVVVMHNPLYTAPEMNYQLADSGAKVAVVLDKMYDTLVKALPGTRVEHVITTSLMEYLPASKRMALRLPLEKARTARKELSADVPAHADVIPFDELLRRARGRARQASVDPARDIALLQYTGGTTGRPKGAMLTHRNLVANAYQVRAFDPGARPGEEVGMAVLPLFHVFGLTFSLTLNVLLGGTVVLLPRFDLDMLLAAIKKYRPTVFPGVPPIFNQIADEPQSRKYRLAGIRASVSGAMQLPRRVVAAYKATTGGNVIQGYGLTETSPVALSNPLDGNARHISVGLPLPSTYALIVDERDPSVIKDVGEAGELIVHGPQVFHGYWNRPEETAEVLLDGWVRTGDIAVMSPDGYFTLIDRKRDVIIVDGLNVYPSEIEEVVAKHPEVEECSVIGVPDRRHGERVVVCVVPRPGAPATIGDIRRHCAEHLAEYKVPSAVVLRSELPKNILGKVLRRVLREEVAAAEESPFASGDPGY